MSKYKRPWKTLEDLKDELWQLKTELFALKEAFKEFSLNCAQYMKNIPDDTGYILKYVDEVNRYGVFIRRIKEDFESVTEEIKEREDAEN